jgi:hypothetical protein
MIKSVNRPLEPVIENAADYVDALTRPRSPETVLKKRVIPGRRMRDKFREPVVVSEVVRKLG